MQHSSQLNKTPLSYTWAAYAACVWAFIFAAMSFYWAAGGKLGLNTQSEQILALMDETWFVAIVWITGVMKAVVGLVALALVRSWGQRFPRWLLLTVAWGAGTLFTLYGGANLIVRGVMALGLIETPESMRSVAARWHLVLWDPWWLLGGVLFLLAAWQFQNRTNGYASGFNSLRNFRHD